MKKKKGFVFIETIVVMAILTVSLLIVYSTYSSLIMKEKTRIRYNDSAYLYRTYYIMKYLENFRLSRAIDLLNEDNLIAGILNQETTENMLFDADEQSFYENLIMQMHIRGVFIAKNDLRPLQECINNENNECESLFRDNGSKNMAAYLKTIGGTGDGYRIIVEFSEKKDGTSCNEENGDCINYYTTLSLGDLE